MRHEIGRLLRLQRLRCGYTLADASSGTGLSFSSIRRLEVGRANNLSHVEIYAAWLGLEFELSSRNPNGPSLSHSFGELVAQTEPVVPPMKSAWILRAGAIRQLLSARSISEAGGSVADLGGRLVAGDLVVPCDDGVWIDAAGARKVRALIREKLDDLNRGSS